MLESNVAAARLVYWGGIAWGPELDVTASTAGLLLTRPNPFGQRTQIRFELTQPAEVDLTVYDASGRRVRTLARGRHGALPFSLSWDGRDGNGAHVAGGVYFLKLAVDDQVHSQRLIRVR